MWVVEDPAPLAEQHMLHFGAACRTEATLSCVGEVALIAGIEGSGIKRQPRNPKRCTLRRSTDGGRSWSGPIELNDRYGGVMPYGKDWDLGYPSTVELADGSLYSLYYQKVTGDPKCSLLSSRWCLP